MFTHQQDHPLFKYQDYKLQLKKPIGSGAYGKVYLAFSESTFKRAVVKICQKPKIQGPELSELRVDEINNPAAQRQHLQHQANEIFVNFCQEAFIQQNLCHENISKSLMCLKTNDKVFMIQEYFSTKTLLDYVQEKANNN